MKNKAKEMSPPSDAWESRSHSLVESETISPLPMTASAQRVDQRLGQESARQVAVRQLDQADQEQQAAATH